MSILAALNSARASLLAQSRALSITSNNIGNVNTPGYTRVRPIMLPIPATSAGLAVGGGSTVDSVIEGPSSVDESSRRLARRTDPFGRAFPGALESTTRAGYPIA